MDINIQANRSFLTVAMSYNNTQLNMIGEQFRLYYNLVEDSATAFSAPKMRETAFVLVSGNKPSNYLYLRNAPYQNIETWVLSAYGESGAETHLRSFPKASELLKDLSDKFDSSGLVTKSSISKEKMLQLPFVPGRTYSADYLTITPKGKSWIPGF